MRRVRQILLVALLLSGYFAPTGVSNAQTTEVNPFTIVTAYQGVGSPPYTFPTYSVSPDGIITDLNMARGNVKAAYWESPDPTFAVELYSKMCTGQDEWNLVTILTPVSSVYSVPADIVNPRCWMVKPRFSSGFNAYPSQVTVTLNGYIGNSPTLTPTPTATATALPPTATATALPPTATNTRTPTNTATATRTPSAVPTYPTSTPSTTRTPTSTPDANNCRVIPVNGSLVTVLAFGTVLTATGSIEFGGQYGTSWQVITGTGIMIPGTSSYYLRGTGSVKACMPQLTPSPTATGTPGAGGCYQVTSTVYNSGWMFVLSYPVPPFTGFDAIYGDVPGNYYGWTVRYVSGAELRLMPMNSEVGVPYINGVATINWGSTGFRLGSHAWSEGHAPGTVEICPPMSTPTPNLTPTDSLTPTATYTPGPATITRTALPTRTPRAPTATGLPTPTLYPTPSGACVQTGIAVGETVSLSVASGAYLRALNGIVVIDGAQANYSIGSGGLFWTEIDGAYPFTAISITDAGIEVLIEICPVGGEPITPTGVPPPTSTPGDPGSGLAPTALAGMPEYVPPITAPGANLGPMPDMQIGLPTMMSRPATATVLIRSAEMTITVVIGAVSTMQTGLQTPMSVIETASAGYSYTTGQQTGQEFGVMMEPALGWIAILNPRHPGWTQRCGPLYAIQPLVLPLAPIIIISLVLTMIRLFLWIAGWVLRLIDLVFKVLQLIRG